MKSHFLFILDVRPLILDCGANTVFSSVWFQLALPDANVVGVEPSSENFRMLEMNTSTLGRFTGIEAAVDCYSGLASLVNRQRDEWGYEVSYEAGKSGAVENCSKAELMPILQGRIVEGSDVYTDGWKAYDGLVTNGFRHHRVHHHANEFARGKNHLNGIESVWSFAKFRMAKLRGVRKEKLLVHLKESKWRFNHRHGNLYLILLKQTRLFPL